MAGGEPVQPTPGEAAFDEIAPRADCLVESLRAFSYELPTAIADLVDNSITAGARRVWVDFFWAGADSVISIADDGSGMEGPGLIAAMRLGSMSPLAHREPHDLGRFGLGLKTASFSQCRRLTVRSRTRGGGDVTRRWDLDHVSRTNQWQLLHGADTAAEQHFARLAGLESGTVVLWQHLDRLVAGQRVDSERAQRTFLERANRVCRHLEMVFHDLMKGHGALELSVNGRALHPWDPYLQDEPATQTLPVTRLTMHDSVVEVRPYVLPHHSKMSATRFAAGSGPNGWNAHQGFYVYRAGRLLVPGDWLGFGWAKEEHHKLARIRVDVPNRLDHDWSIDVTKSRAFPPSALRDELRAIAERTRNLAKRVYSFRGAIVTPGSDAARVLLWEPVSKHDKVTYRLNPEHPLMKLVSASTSDRAALGALLRLIEETIPSAHITIRNTEEPTSLRGPFDGASDLQVTEVMAQSLRALVKAGYREGEAMERLRALWPFELFPDLLNALLPGKQ